MYISCIAVQYMLDVMAYAPRSNGVHLYNTDIMALSMLYYIPAPHSVVAAPRSGSAPGVYPGAGLAAPSEAPQTAPW